MQLDKSILKEIVQDSGLSFKQNSKSWIFTCPKCLKHEKLYIRKMDGRFVCWHCKESGFYGKPEYALALLLSRSIQELRKRLYGGDFKDGTTALQLDISGFLDEEDEVPEEEATERIYPPDFYPISHEFSQKGRDYLGGRGIPVEVASEYEVQYWSTRQRVVFPIVMDTKLYGWEARTIYPSERVDPETGEVTRIPKTLGLEDMKKDLLVMFKDRLKGSEHAVVCEGAVDAMKAHLCGGNVATMGKAVSLRKIQIIRAAGVRKVYVALDPDAAADTAKLVKTFGDMEVFHMKPMAGKKDLGEMSFEDVREQFLTARRVNAGNVFLFLKTPKRYAVRS